MNLFQSIFGRGEARGRYPESLIEAAIERAVDGTDARLRLLPGYRKRLLQPVVQAADHVIALVDAIGGFVPAGRLDHGTEPRLAAPFASAADMLAVFARDAQLEAFQATPDGRAAERITALLVAERAERNVLGMELVGDQVRRDVHQVVVSFGVHRLLDPQADEAETRRQLKRRAFDHLLGLALKRITERRLEPAELTRQRDLLRRKLKVLEGGGWGFDTPEQTPADPARLAAELDTITAQLQDLGADQDTLRTHLDLVAELLADAEHQLWGQQETLWLDAMNIQRAAGDPSAREIVLAELRNAHGQRLVMLPISITTAELPARADLVSAAQRYLF